MSRFGLIVGLGMTAVAVVLSRALRTLKHSRADQNLSPEETETAARALRERAGRVRCPRCNGPSLTLGSSGRGYRCEACNLGFVGPDLMANRDRESRAG